MNRHFQALIVKFFIALAVTGFLLLFTELRMPGALWVALTATLVTYLVADIPFLPILGKNLTVALDTTLVLPVFWGMTWLYTGSYPSFPVLFALALTVAAGEWVFHGYALKNVMFPMKTGRGIKRD